VAELYRRTNVLEELKEPVITYAVSQPDYAGSWIDNDRGGILVVQFSGPLFAHQAAIFSKVRPDAPIEVRQVRWSTAELQALAVRVRAESAWFATIPAYVYAYGPNDVENKFWISLSSADPDVAATVRVHFGWREDMVTVDSDGTGALLLEPGTLEIHAVDASGRPVAGLACVAIPDIDGAYEPRPLPMPTTDADGNCSIQAAAGAYTIHLEHGAGPPTVVAVGRASIHARRLTATTIVVP
jgi:hypothetical protein